jgi:hypothetical protein
MIVPVIAGLVTGGATAIGWLVHSKRRWPDLFGGDDFGKAAMLGTMGFIPGYLFTLLFQG